MTPPAAAHVASPGAYEDKSAAPDPTKATTPTSTAGGRAGPSYDRHNRVDVIRRMCDLQHADGHWDYSDELAALARRWGGRELTPAAPHGATALAQACLMELCGHVWAAQRDGTEDTALSAAEVASLQMMHWDLGFARSALDRATAWLGGFR